MLVLSRKVGEQIRIAEDIVVVVAEIEGGRVKLGIQAPRSIPILRTGLSHKRPAGRSVVIEEALATNL